MRSLLAALLFLVLPAAAQPSISAVSWAIADENGSIILERDATLVRSIASVTKLMTVVVVLDRNMSLDQHLEIRPIKGISTNIPRTIKTLTRYQLIELAMVKSDNLAAHLLCANYNGQGFDSSLPCVDAMNARASSLGMTSTRFIEPTGLYNDNVSTARDLIKLVREAAKYPIIVAASDKVSITITARGKKKPLTNTNPLVTKHTFIVSKTGWIRASGGCIVTMVASEQGRRIIIILGSKSTKTRIDELEIFYKLVDREDQDWLYRYFGIER